MAKLTLAVAPTFKSNVSIPVQGKKPVSVEFTFLGRSKDEFRAYLETATDRDEVDLIMDTITGWELEDQFSRDNVELLLQSHPASGKALFEKYISEVSGARLGN